MLLANSHFVSAENTNVQSAMIDKTIKAVRTVTVMPQALVERGVSQAAALWTSQDGTQEDFQKFCKANFCSVCVIISK